jgi:ERCC4-type nuclease
MQQNPHSALTISVTKPKGKTAIALAAMGILVLPAEEDLEDVDRYVISRRLAIERRTGGSVLRGIVDKTLFTSAIYLREHFEIPILIAEGSIDYSHTAFSPQAVRGALSSMLLTYGVSVLSTPDVQETVAMIAMMARQEQIGIPDISLVPKRKATDLADMQRRIVEMLPGCGMTMARRLLQHFGSVKRIVNADEAGFRCLRGLGTKKAAEIRRVLDADYESVDTERDLEDAIAASPELLFSQPVTMLARQHLIYADTPHPAGEAQRHIVDLVFLDVDADELILVELKRGRLASEHEQQIRRYLDHAHQSKLLRPLLEGGTRLRGILATIEDTAYQPSTPSVSTRVVDKEHVISVLKQSRRRRLDSSADA